MQLLQLLCPLSSVDMQLLQLSWHATAVTALSALLY
jgi:hypothetical protein